MKIGPRRDAGEILWVAAAGLAGPLLGVAAGNRWLFPLLSAVAFYPLFLRLIRGRSIRGALAFTLLWTLLHSGVSISLAHHDSQRYERAVLKGESYRLEMFHWLETGEGAEGDPRLFIPIHLGHLALFLLLTWISRGAGGLLLGILLLNYMNAYVGALSREGPPLLLGVLGWHPWAILRVVGFLLAAILLVRPIRGGARRLSREWLWVLALLAGDIALKWLLAPAWRTIIEEVRGG
ncbi:MAG: hypothetical protein ACE5GW_01870 [Planctomycetota bacterium]